MSRFSENWPPSVWRSVYPRYSRSVYCARFGLRYKSSVLKSSFNCAISTVIAARLWEAAELSCTPRIWYFMKYLTTVASLTLIRRMGKIVQWNKDCNECILQMREIIYIVAWYDTDRNHKPFFKIYRSWRKKERRRENVTPLTSLTFHSIKFEILLLPESVTIAVTIYRS